MNALTIITGPTPMRCDTLEEFGIIELNEAFAAQVLACTEEMPEFDLKRVNPNGGAIALGHPWVAAGPESPQRCSTK